MLREHFEAISDPREQHKVKHSLLEVIIMVICAVVAECEAWYQIEHYCLTKRTWFRKKLKLPPPVCPKLLKIVAQGLFAVL